MNIKKYGIYPSQIGENNSSQIARITAVHRDLYSFVSEQGEGLAHLKAGEYYENKQPYPTTGDFVVLDFQKQGKSRILKTLPRRTCFTRRDPEVSGRGEQVVASNFDTVFVLESVQSEINLRRIERYLLLSWQSGAMPVVVLTKTDTKDEMLPYLRAVEQVAPGVPVHALSAKTGEGLAQLDPYLSAGQTVILLGPSGVGKSSLINALAGKSIMKTREVRQRDQKGRHTTTRRQLIMLPGGSMVIDTPGMRELGMWDISKGQQKSFSDVEEYFGQCKFRDCRHQSEPGCAVKEAIVKGELSRDRWEHYLQLQTEAEFTNDKKGYLQRKTQWEKEISKFQKEKKQTPDYQVNPCVEIFTCTVCGNKVSPEEAGSQHRNHCPQCLSSLHVDSKTGDRASLCRGTMDPIGVWVRKNGEWAIIHRCRSCGLLRSNRVAADDNPTLLMSIAVKPLSAPPFPLWKLDAKENGKDFLDK